MYKSDKKIIFVKTKGMKEIEIEIYMSNFRAFFDKNPKQLVQLIGYNDPELFYNKIRKIVEDNSKSESKPLEPTRQQMLDLVLEINGASTNSKKNVPFISHHMGIIGLN